MHQRYTWQVLFLVKFLQSEFSDPVFRKWLRQSLAHIVTGLGNGSPTVVHLCIETDLPLSELLETVPEAPEAENGQYILGMRLHNLTPIAGGSPTRVKLKDTQADWELILCKNERVMDDGNRLGYLIEQMNAGIICDNTMVVTLDHGSAYGIFYEPQPQEGNQMGFQKGFLKSVAFPSFFYNDLSYRVGFPKTNATNTKAVLPEFTPEDTDPNIFSYENIGKSKSLTMDELAEALQKLPSGKADVLLMANCYMNTIDTQYALHKCVGYLVAAQSPIPFQVFPFFEIMGRVSDAGNITPGRLSEWIIAQIPNAAAFHVNKDALKKISIAAIHLASLNEHQVWASFKDMCIALDKEATDKEWVKSVQMKRRKYLNIPLLWGINETNLHLTDGHAMLSDISKIRCRFPETQGLIQTFLNRYRQYSNTANPAFTYIGTNARTEDYACNGWSLFFPAFASGFTANRFILFFYNQVPGNPNVSAIARDTFWNNFLFKYYKAIR